NNAKCTFTVMVSDPENPTISCLNGPQNSSADRCRCSYAIVGAEIDHTGSADTYASATATNDYHNTSTLAGAVFPKGTTLVTWTVTDASGNNAKCTFTVVVSDTEPPTISCPSDITRNTDPGFCKAVVTFSATTHDNCSGETN